MVYMLLWDRARTSCKRVWRSGAVGGFSELQRDGTCCLRSLLRHLCISCLPQRAGSAALRPDRSKFSNLRLIKSVANRCRRSRLYPRDARAFAVARGAHAMQFANGILLNQGNRAFYKAAPTWCARQGNRHNVTVGPHYWSKRAKIWPHVWSSNSYNMCEC